MLRVWFSVFTKGTWFPTWRNWIEQVAKFGAPNRAGLVAPIDVKTPLNYLVNKRVIYTS